MVTKTVRAFLQIAQEQRVPRAKHAAVLAQVKAVHHGLAVKALEQALEALEQLTCAGQSSEIPSRGIFSMARACRGMSGRDHASGAGDRSSVLVSPVTLNTVTVNFSDTAGLARNHSALAQDSITCSEHSVNVR
jgi:hypothetical protein